MAKKYVKREQISLILRGMELKAKYSTHTHTGITKMRKLHTLVSKCGQWKCPVLPRAFLTAD